jgi:hypothetical protein
VSVACPTCGWIAYTEASEGNHRFGECEGCGVSVYFKVQYGRISHLFDPARGNVWAAAKKRNIAFPAQPPGTIKLACEGCGALVAAPANGTYMKPCAVCGLVDYAEVEGTSTSRAMAAKSAADLNTRYNAMLQNAVAPDCPSGKLALTCQTCGFIEHVEPAASLKAGICSLCLNLNVWDAHGVVPATTITLPPPPTETPSSAAAP